MPKKIKVFIAATLSLSLMAVSSVASANDNSIDSLKDELRAEYREDLKNYRALEDKSLDSVKNMRQNLMNMATEAKKIRDLMKEIKAKSAEEESSDEVAELKSQMDSHVASFRQIHGEFSNLLTEYNQPDVETPLVEAQPIQEVADDLMEDEPEEEFDRGVAEEAVEEEYTEKIVISEGMGEDVASVDMEDDFEFDSELE